MKSKAFPYSLLTFLLIFSCQSPPADTSTIIEDYFQPFPNQIVNINSAAAASSMGDQAMRLYEEGRYDQAIILFNELIQIEGAPAKSYSWIFYKGNAELAQGQLDNALKSFAYIPSDHPNHQDAQWLNSLIFLQKGEKERAKSLLKLIQQDHPKQAQVQSILKSFF